MSDTDRKPRETVPGGAQARSRSVTVHHPEVQGPFASHPQVITIPSTDHAFRVYVGSLGAAPSPGELEQRLRAMFPLVVVRERVLSGEPAWYVYRDGTWRPPEGAWWEDPGLPRVRVAHDGWLVEADRTAADWLGIDHGAVRDHHFTDFVVPGTLQDSVALFDVVRSGQPLTATVRLKPQADAAIAVELHAWSDDEGITGVFRVAPDVAGDLVNDMAGLTVRGPAQVVTVPASDVAFRAYVLRALGRMPEPTPDGLDLRIGRLYPHAVTSVEGDAWTVHRDPRSVDTATVDWWHDTSLPRVRYDRQALILEANPAAVDLFGHDMVGHHWQEFVLPGTTDEVAVMLAILAETGAAESRFRMPRHGGGLVEFDSYTSFDGDDMVTVMRAPAGGAT